MYIKTLTVTSLNNYLKKIIDNDFILGNAYVEGEISNLKIHSSGHIYFSLKDFSSKINCIMFRSYAENLKIIPKDGMQVIVKGRVSVYVKDGQYQLYCSELSIKGVGELYIAFEKMKDKLEKEELFKQEYKKPIPKFPRRIGIITSPTGAAIRDIINVSLRRNSRVNMLIYPALVQGESAQYSIIDGIKYLNKIADVDVIILARGGGSIEELWSFNEEELARQVFKSKKPIVTGVGHQTDFTIADFVADLRAPTPSAAAEIVVPNVEEIKLNLAHFESKLHREMKNVIINKNKEIDILRNKLELKSPVSFIANEYNNIDNLKEMLNYKIATRLKFEKDRLANINSLLQAHNPLNILNKGYAVIENNDSVITTVEKLKDEKQVNITLKDGSGKFQIRYLEEK